AGPHRVGLAGPEADLLLRVAEEEPQPALQDVERVLDVRVGVPRHLLGLRDLELADPEARPLGVARAALDLVEMARVLDGVHEWSSAPDCATARRPRHARGRKVCWRHMGARRTDADEVLAVDGRAVSISHPDKVLFPAAGYTKRDLARYYLA